ncbi:MAG: hypothetical protein CMJ64_17170 [Planctomycetaceae bacterium]|nr:hypothetical protein [Planctomycetaceae bacterium]
MPTQTFRQVTIVGNAQQRGRSYGEQLADEILQTVKVYRELLPRSDDFLLAGGERVRNYLKSLDPNLGGDLVAEIDAIGEAIRGRYDFDARWLYALNARTELLGLGVDECTSVCFQETGLLGQNWDWARALEERVVFMTIVPDDGPTIWMLTEPGIIGKIGMNSSGVGACLNILRCRRDSLPIDGLPIHLVLRAILNSESLNEARETLMAYHIDTASNILAGDGAGACFDVEFAGTEQRWLAYDAAVTLHTNHYCADGTHLNAGFEDELQSSFNRYARGSELVSKLSAFGLAEMDELLCDQSGDLPINREYVPYAGFPPQHTVGTVATLLMDLRNRQLYLRRGPYRPDQDLVEMPLGSPIS